MALFICVNNHQGDELFSVHSRGKRCALTDYEFIDMCKPAKTMSIYSVQFVDVYSLKINAECCLIRLTVIRFLEQPNVDCCLQHGLHILTFII